MAFALPGSLYLYQGEELGLPEVFDIPDDRREDPVFHLTLGTGIGRDGCRIPLPWTADACDVVRILEPDDRPRSTARGFPNRPTGGVTPPAGNTTPARCSTCTDS